MRDKKGFTLVELLAVVVILGIIMTVSIPAVSKWISRSKGDSKEAQEKTLLLAGESYAQGNSKVLPKAIGDTKLIKAEDLKKANYLKEDLKDADKKDCMKDSFVRIYKYDKTGYTYTAYIYCEGDTVPADITGVQPFIDISFSGDNVHDDDNKYHEDVSISAFTATIQGSSDNSELGIDGYSYSISVKYGDSGEIVEIFNSGSLNAGGRTKLVIEKRLSDYTNITTVSEFLVTVEAYNRDGGYLKQTANSKYGDTKGPKCGEITGQAGVDQWFNSPKTSTISVKCIDEENGSGCVKNEFTKSWNTEVEEDVITISDNAGNTTDCTVRVHHDWTYPTAELKAYKRKSDGSKDTLVGTITANNDNREVSIMDYSNSYGATHWLNYNNFPYGVYYEITVSDNIHIDKGQWLYNNSDIYNENDSNLSTMNIGSFKTFTTDDNIANVYLSSEGLRRARYEVTDKAGNKTVIQIEANIDRTNPICTIAKDSSTVGKTSGVTINITCTDNQSGCSPSNTLRYTGCKATATYNVLDVANNMGGCSVTIVSGNCNCSNCHHRANTCKGGYVSQSAYQYCPYAHSGDKVCATSRPSEGHQVCGTCTLSVYKSCATGSPNACQYGCDTCYS